jgi:copper chaperone NosL
MNKLIVLLVVALFSCSAEPEVLHFGKDACHACKMTLMDNKFGAELVTKKGKVYKFDDVNCMLSFFHSGVEAEENIAYKLVIDFSHPEKLIDASNAYFLKSDEIKSPMGSHVAAFEKKEDLEIVKNDLKVIYLVWGELVTQFK